MNGNTELVITDMAIADSMDLVVRKRFIFFMFLLMMSQSTFSVLPLLTSSVLQKIGGKISVSVVAGAIFSKIAGTFKEGQSGDSRMESSAQLVDAAIMAVTDVSDVAVSVANAAAGITADVVVPLGIGAGVAIYRYKKRQQKKALLEGSEPQSIYDLRHMHEDKKYHESSEWKYYLAWIGCLAMYKIYKAHKVCQDNNLTVWLSSLDTNITFQKMVEDGALEHFVQCKSELYCHKLKRETYSKDVKSKKIQDFTLVACPKSYSADEPDNHKAAFDFLNQKRAYARVAWTKPDSDRSQCFNVDAKKYGWFSCNAYEDDNYQYFMCRQHRPGYFEHMSKQQVFNTLWMIKSKMRF